MGKPGKSYNDLELVEGDIVDDESNEHNGGVLDPRAGNVSIEIPRIKFNPKDVAKLLNKYVTEVDCTRKCLVEITKLMKWYNRLGEGILPYKPKDLKLNSQVLKRKKNKNLSKMVKEGVKKLEMVDSKIKKSGRLVNDDHKSLKELENLGELIVEHGNIGKSVWKVRKFDECNALKENFSLNGSWTVSEDTKSADQNITECVSDNEPPLLVPVGFNVEISDVKEKTPMKTQSKTSPTPSLKSLTDSGVQKKSNSNKRKSPISKIADESNTLKQNNIQKLNSPSIKKSSPIIPHKSHVVANTSHNNSWSVSADNDGSASKKVKNCELSIKPEKRILSPSLTSGNALNSSKNDKKYNSPSILSVGIETVGKRAINACDDVQILNNSSLMKRRSISNKIQNNDPDLNMSWTVCSDEKLNLSKGISPKSKIADESLNVLNTSQNNSWSVTNDNEGSASKKAKKVKESIKEEKRTSSSFVATPDKTSKSPKSPKSPTPEQRVLRRRTIIIPKKKTDGQQNEVLSKKKVKDNSSETKASQKRRKTIAGEEISMLKPEEISNKALEKVVSYKV